MASAWMRKAHRRAVDFNPAAGRDIHADQRPGHLGAPGPHQAEEGQYLALP